MILFSTNILRKQSKESFSTKDEEKVFFRRDMLQRVCRGGGTYLYTKYRYWIVYTAIEDLSTSAYTAAQRLVVIPNTPTNPVSALH